ncbi:hypothetical protein B0H13DRAFT_2336278 [Mycena leptocephala]|nr:hypothetical protein B0H13DRAFT_2336278 [Mycena leptocephala]
MLRFFSLALLITAVVASPVTHVTNLTAAIGNIWILVPQDPSGTGSTFMIQSATFPDMFISYASFGAPATTPIHSQLVLRGRANAAGFSLQTLAGGNTLNIMVPAIGKVIASWTSTLTDTTTPVTVATLQTGSAKIMACCPNGGPHPVIRPFIYRSDAYIFPEISLFRLQKTPIHDLCKEVKLIMSTGDFIVGAHIALCLVCAAFFGCKAVHSMSR